MIRIPSGLAFSAFAFALALPAFNPTGAATERSDRSWHPAKGPLQTRWSNAVSPENAHPEYPRPQLVRKEWLNLNGLWDYAITPRESSVPSAFQGKILVPFPIESALSGVMKPVGDENRLWYHRTFQVPGRWKEKRVLLHFEAVDWQTTVYVNSKEVGVHQGGYDGFSFDITEALNPSGDQELILAVYDPTDAGAQPRGKQVRQPRGIWYTSTTGIWQTVWLEPVAATSIDEIKLVPNIDEGTLELLVRVRGAVETASVEAVALEGSHSISKASAHPGEKFHLRIPQAKLWSPDSPHLYQLKLTIRERGKKTDEANSYFAMRKISLGKDERGFTRMLLNNKPLFEFGPLDQGFWPDGIYTAPTDEALRYDIETTRKLGFNMARKHVKIEPDRWYYWCDKLGLLVWQDIPSGDRYIGAKDPDIKRSEASAKEFEEELKRLLEGRGNHPCIVMWVPFNEGWGQYDTPRVVEMIKRLDPSRLVDNTSGWSDRGVGDVHDIHSYPGPAAPSPAPNRAAVLGEFGGLGLPIAGHTWQTEKNWGYRSFKNPEQLTDAYLELIKKLRPLIGSNGLSAAVYTQTTDVEIEVNGLMTYDRALIKMDANKALAANKTVYAEGSLTKTSEPAKGSPAVKQETQASQTAHPKGAPLYVSNRAPLELSAFIKLPIGSITPKGWLRTQLELEAQGMTGHLEEISKWCKFEGNAWASPEGNGHSGWEELPYWLKGYGDLGYVLHNETIIREARKWIDAVLSSQEPDGWFGPRSLKTSLQGKPDLWPHMVMLNVLQSFYEFTSDERVLPFLTRYFRWLNSRPGEDFGNGYWPKIRFGDNIESVYWLFNRTGEPWLLDLARKIHGHMADWTSGVINWHNVNLAQGFREPALFYLQAHDPKFLQAAERNYETIMGRYGQFPGGGFAGDENCRPGFTDPRQGFETCGIVEFMHSFEMLTKISGNPIWPDRCEEIAFNSFPAALTPDWKGLHYLTCANQVQLDRANHAPEIENGGTMFSYSPFQVYRCCQHNVSHGWPYYAQELWLATPDGGLCASLYAASEVNAKVAGSGSVTIAEETDYPFNDTIQLRIAASQPVRFPLYLRLPRWCDKPSVRVNGKAASARTKPLSYLVLDRSWHDGDVVTLRLPMEVKIRRWENNHQAASVEYGPLGFSLRIDEKWMRYGDNAQWPEWEVFPGGAWNYGLILNHKNPAKSFEVVKKAGPILGNPFTPASAPIELRAKAKRIPGWTIDKLGLVGQLQDSPVKSDEPEEVVTLIPMGAARLRISAFPVIGSGNAAHDWVASSGRPVSATH